MVLSHTSIDTILSTASNLCRTLSEGLEDLRAVLTEEHQSPHGVGPLKPDLPDWLRGVRVPSSPPPWMVEECAGDYSAWYMEQLELRHSEPHRVDPEFDRHEEWARVH